MYFLRGVVNGDFYPVNYFREHRRGCDCDTMQMKNDPKWHKFTILLFKKDMSL